jgi:hypothetical protein
MAFGQLDHEGMAVNDLHQSTPRGRQKFMLPCRRFLPLPRLTIAGQNTKEEVMPKALPIAAFLIVMALSPAYAASDECTEAHMKQMDQMISEMTDAAAKKAATTHLDMSKAEMKKGNEAGCMEHMAEAHKAMGL